MKKEEKRPKNDNGAGSIVQQPDGRWVARLYLGRGPNGKGKVKALYGNSQAEVKRKLKSFKHDLAKYDDVNIQHGSVRAYMNDWLTTSQKIKLKPKSYDRLEVTLENQVYPYIGHIQLAVLKSSDIQRMINSLIDKGLSYSSIKKAYDAVHSCFAKGVLQKSVLFNPAVGVALPASDFRGETVLKFYEPEEVAKLYAVAIQEYKPGTKSYRLAPFVILDLNTGLRVGELIGLKWEDIDFKRRVLRVRRNSVVVKDRSENSERKYIRIEQNSTKTKAGIREVYLNDDAIIALQKLLPLTGKFDYVLSTQDGHPVSFANLDSMFRKMVRAAGLPDDKQYGVHSLRHTFASLLFASGEDVKTVSALLGHADTTITYNTYIHLIDGKKQKALRQITNFIKPQFDEMQSEEAGNHIE